MIILILFTRCGSAKNVLHSCVQTVKNSLISSIFPTRDAISCSCFSYIRLYFSQIINGLSNDSFFPFLLPHNKTFYQMSVFYDTFYHLHYLQMNIYKKSTASMNMCAQIVNSSSKFYTT